jgi:Tfp pilus assembly protein PilN
MRAVNLLPRDDAQRRTPKVAAPMLAVGLLPLVVVGALAGAYSMESGKVADKRAQLTAVEAELARTPAPVPIDPTNTALATEKNSRIGAVSDALGRRVAFDRVLRELSLVLPEDVWLSSMQAQSPDGALAAGSAPAPAPPASTASGEAAPAATTSAPPAAATGSTPANSPFVLIGFTYSQEGVARLLSRLSVLPHLSNVRLTSSVRVPAGKRSVVEFTITADLRSPKESS